MSEDLIKRSDAIEAVKRVSENYTGKGKRDYHPHVDFIVDELKYCVPSADTFIDEAPSIDICFCRECVKHNTHRCHMAFDLVATDDDDFCSYGKREGE